MPTNARAMPTDPIRMYFHEASTDDFVTRSGMSSAETIVVASMATHIRPTLATSTAASIVSVNRFEKTTNRET